MSAVCTDRVVGQILAGWRYDISGIAPEMRGDYEAHLAECERCRSQQKFHRVIDFSLLLVCKISAVLFLAAFFAVRHFYPDASVIMQWIAVAGILVSGVIWVIICMTTPVPVMVFGAVKQKAREIHEKLPDDIKARIPDQIVEKIAEKA